MGYSPLCERANLTAAGGPYYFYTSVESFSDAVFQWSLGTAAGAAPAAALTVYSTVQIDRAKLEAPLSDANKYWTNETPYGAVFATVPGTVANASDRIELYSSAFSFVMIKVDVLADLTDFTLSCYGKS